MFDGFDQTRLLAYIEGELTPDEATTLENELSGRPEVRAALDQLRADRTLLRSLPEPALPADLVASLEPILARPMLVQPSTPGAWRRGRREPISTRRIVTVVGAAAGLLLAVTAGLIALVGQPGGGTPMATGEGGSDPTVPTPTPTELATNDEPAEWPLDGVIHHDIHVPEAMATADRADDGIDQAPTGPVALPFTLAMSVNDLSGWEQTAVSTLEPHGRTAALVQNFSMDEGDALMAWLDGQASAVLVERPQVASVLISSARKRDWKSFRDAAEKLPRPERPKMSEQLAGDKRHAAPYLTQLDYADRGATHTITVSLAELDAVLAQLTRGSTDAVLQMLDEPDWIADRTAIRETITRLRDANPDAVVFLPVTVLHSD
jgi:hypothetical protein